MKIDQIIGSHRITRDAPNDKGGGTPPATPPAGNPWFHGADAELIGHIQAQGWHEKPANEVALAAIAQARQNAAFNGVPADKLVRLPDGPQDEAGLAAFRAKIGVPADAKGYDFSALKNEKGEPLLDQARADFFANTALKLGIPKDAAVQLAQEVLTHEASTATSAAAEKTAKLTEEHKVLDANWGQNKEANLFLARKGAEKLGLDAEAVQALENVAGYAKTMEALRKVGELAGEARFVNGNPNVNGGVMTREQAVARKAELMRDTAWTKRYLDGGAAEGREMTALNTLIVGDDTEMSRYA